ncbi:slipin family protein [Flavobacterium sp.]|uniref:slipin family protein n=1 Tax=Flavobacterium sp. TaxID=239 RepID=UPI001207A56C|nr:slipin family protein [Flavobacterium sp.]RZJ71253.1 MAG: slipin family protein [Flavobacterium sp.]
MFYILKANQAGLVFNDGKVKKVLTQGKNWVFGYDYVEVHDMTHSFQSKTELNILLQNQQLAAMLEVVEVKDGEIVLLFTNGIFNAVLTAGRYAFWKSIMSYEFVKADISKAEIDDKVPDVLLDHVKLRPFVRKFFVPSDETGLLYIDGKFEKQLKSGMYSFWQNNVTVEVKCVDLRLRFLEISGQELLTKDKAALRINFFAQFKVFDAVKVLSENRDYEKQLYILLQLALRQTVSALSLDELLSKKDSLGKEILSEVAQKAKAMGIEVFEAGIRDVILPGEMKDIMNQVLVAEKKAQANSIMRREETASTRSLLNTAKLMEENEMLFKLKEMEYVEKIAEKVGSISVSGSGQIVDQLRQIFSK